MNPILEKIIAGIEEHVKPENKRAYDNTVLAGKKILFDPKTHSHMQLIANPESQKDPVGTISNGVAGLIWIMYRESKNSMLPEVMIMAGITLMCDVLDFAERGLNIKIDNQMVAATTKGLTDSLFSKLKITPEQMREAVKKGRAEIMDYKAKYGNTPPSQGMLQGKPDNAQPATQGAE
jgi:hypothetical protein